ncbi:hypothetical protein ABK905_26025 [Acerihabitans sp. KWT182]|uniref:Copper resistance protein ScsC N-terminal domain-containing protein n=1 Tax=Acerihabitans sp. KWT182 TaxID=3157919 RepID=A0AAU7Q991_9GAMM
MMKQRIINGLIAVLCLAISGTTLALSPVPASDTPDYSADQQAQIGKIAAGYLLAHPEILREMKSELQADKKATITPRCPPATNGKPPAK